MVYRVVNNTGVEINLLNDEEFNLIKVMSQSTLHWLQLHMTGKNWLNMYMMIKKNPSPFKLLSSYTYIYIYRESV